MREQLTESDVAKIKEEIEYRTVTLRYELLEHVKVARAQGDLSENFEYKEAKRAKNKNESRIKYLQRLLNSAIVISDISKEDEVGLNKRVTIYIPEDDEEETYKIVTSIRGDMLDDRISNISPLGKALMGHKVGDTVTIHVNDEVSYDAVIRQIENVGEEDTDAIRGY